MHDNTQFLFDFWANLFVQLIVLKSSMARLFADLCVSPIEFFKKFLQRKKEQRCCHNSVESSALTILPPQVRVLRTLSTLL